MKPVLVAAGVLRDAQGRVLLARRPPQAHQGGLWEFPGGKVEKGETVVQALGRELAEELGIEVVECRPLIRVAHDYGDRRVVLDTWLVTRWRGRPQGREGQPLAWVAPDELAARPMPAADRPIVTALRLPGRYVITPPVVEQEAAFLQALERTLQGGVRLIQFRLFGMEPTRWRALARQALSLCHEFGARLLLNSALEEALKLGADGVHLSSQRLLAQETLPLERQSLLVGASCHNAQELRRAEALKVDFAVLSPVLPTASHPDATPLGWTRFQKLVERMNLPVYALGGMTPALEEKAWLAGGQGIAGIRGLWRAKTDRA